MTEAADLPQVFQHWRWQGPSDTGDLVSFVQPERTGPPPLWRMSLPPQPQAAVDLLEQSERQLALTQAALEQAPSRLERVLQALQAGGQVQFGVTYEAPEHDLMRWLETLEPGSVGFAAESPSQTEVNRAASQFSALMSSLLNQMSHLAWVETQFGGQLLARSIVGWDGDVHTLWKEKASLDDWLWHQHSLRLALASRFALLRMVTLVVQGAGKIGVLMATPGGALLALAAMWQFMNRLMAELQASA